VSPNKFLAGKKSVKKFKSKKNHAAGPAGIHAASQGP
jgi:hypothetical protein